MSLFNRPAWARPHPSSTSNVDEAQDDIFSHAKRTYQDIFDEEQRKRQAKLEKKMRKERRNSGKREIMEDADGCPSPKKTRISLPDEAEDESDVVITDEKLGAEIGPGKDGKLEGIDAADSSTRSPRRRSPRKNKANPAVDGLTWNQSHDIQLLELEDGEDDGEGQAHMVQQSLPTVEVLEEESDDDFAALARKAREQRHKKTATTKSQTPDVGLHSQSPDLGVLDTGQDRAAAPDLPDPPVKLFLSSNIQGTAPMIFYRKLSQNLAEVKKYWCARQGISEEAAKDIFLIHRMRRVYDVTTCRSLGLEVDSLGNLTLKGAEGEETVEEVQIEAVTEELFRQLKADRVRQAQRREDEEQTGAGAENGGVAPDHSKESLIRLVLRAKGREDFKLKVKPTTTFARISKAYFRERHLSDDQSVRLEYDGETLDPDDEMQSMEIEDNDCIDVYITSN